MVTQTCQNEVRFKKIKQSILVQNSESKGETRENPRWARFNPHPSATVNQTIEHRRYLALKGHRREHHSSSPRRYEKETPWHRLIPKKTSWQTRSGREKNQGWQQQKQSSRLMERRHDPLPGWKAGRDIPHSQTLGWRLGTACNEVCWGGCPDGEMTWGGTTETQRRVHGEEDWGGKGAKYTHTRLSLKAFCLAETLWKHCCYRSNTFCYCITWKQHNFYTFFP